MNEMVFSLTRRFAAGLLLSMVLAPSFGVCDASAAKNKPPSIESELGARLQAQYKECWIYNGNGLTGQPKYIAEIHVLYTQEGSLIGEPILVNPPSDPNLRNLAASALRAVRNCNPVRIPAVYLPYYDQWKDLIVRFDPEVM
jgi:colicin import membrane protein